MTVTDQIQFIKTYRWGQLVPIEPLIWFRIIFGILVTYTSVRFVANDWINQLLVAPDFHFSYFGWNWIQPLSISGMNIIMGILIFCGICITLGFLYRIAIIAFTFLFAYIELIDQSNYLNHYYFIFLISFLLIWVPANAFFSLDSKFGITSTQKLAPRWSIDIFKFQIGVLYFFAGISKLNYYWLIEAQPLTNWLKHQTDLPLIGGLMKYSIIPYLFAWFGCLYDLSITFLLLFKKTRIWAYILVVLFHSLVGLMFPIGVFPITMILLTTLFFDSSIFERLFSKFNLKKPFLTPRKKSPQIIRYALLLYITLQVFIPFRYLLHSGELFWTEQGFRFSWRVMLIEKVGYTEFYVSPQNDNRRKLVEPNAELTLNQIKMMNTQPDMILQYAHHLRDTYRDQIIIENGDTIRMKTPQVFVNSYVSLFNQGNRPFVKTNVDLSKIQSNTPLHEWIHSYE